MPLRVLLLPSTDKIGRRFPLTLAWLGDGIDAEALASAERLGHATIDEMLSPDQLADAAGRNTGRHSPAGARSSAASGGAPPMDGNRYFCRVCQMPGDLPR